MALVLWISSACIAVLSVVVSNNVTVEETLTALVGAEVLLPCQIENESTQITQIAWRKTNEERDFAVYHPRYGISYSNESNTSRIAFRNHSRLDGSILINPLELQDEGNYLCSFTTFTVGVKEKRISLMILAIPSNSVSLVLARAGDFEVPVASCTSTNGKPAANITWMSNMPGNSNSTQTTNDNGTVTVTSQYMIAPNSSNNGQTVTCVISHATSKGTDKLRVTLSVQYPPEVSIKGYDGNWDENTRAVTLKCEAKANPPEISYSWPGLLPRLPAGLDSEGADLFIEKVDSSMNGTWTCEATNEIGTGTGKVEIIVKDKGAKNKDHPEALSMIHIAIIAAVIVGVVVLVLALVLMWRKRRTQETAATPDANSSQIQDEQRTVYASLDLNVLERPSAQRENFHHEEATVYAAVKHSQR